MESRGQVDLVGRRGKEDCLACQGFPDQKDIVGFQDWTVQKDQGAVLERRVNRVALVRWDHLDQWDLLDQEEKGDEKDHQVLPVCVGLMA